MFTKKSSPAVDIDAELEALQTKRREQIAIREAQLLLVGKEPDAAKAARAAKNRIAEIDDEISEYADVLEARRKEKKLAEEAACHAACEAQRRNAVKAADARAAKLAPQVDAKFNELIELLAAYRAAGEPIAEDTRAAVYTIHHGLRTERQMDILHFAMASARGRSRVTSAALAPYLYRLVEVLQAEGADDWAIINSNAARSQETFASAASAEAKELRSVLKVD